MAAAFLSGRYGSNRWLTRRTLALLPMLALALGACKSTSEGGDSSESCIGISNGAKDLLKLQQQIGGGAVNNTLMESELDDMIQNLQNAVSAAPTNSPTFRSNLLTAIADAQAMKAALQANNSATAGAKLNALDGDFSDLGNDCS